MKKLAILTSTYNRAYVLPTLYESLLKQTSYDFVWYIIDDGSTDDTSYICNGFSREKFDIQYFKKENGGKHTALNYAYDLIDTELTFIVDSDDFLTVDAVETILRDWEKYRSDPAIAGLSYYKMYKNRTIVGDRYSQETTIDTYINQRINKKIMGDKAEVYRTELLKQNRFPVFPNEKFMSEAVVWCKISQEYSLVFIAKGIYICEYLQDGLTKEGRVKQILNPRGTMEHAKAHMCPQVKWTIRLKYFVLYLAASRFANIRLAEAVSSIKYGKLLCILFYPAGYCLYKSWTAKYTNSDKLTKAC